MAEITSEYRALDDLRPHERNYNRHEKPGVVARMAEKIRHTAFTAPCIVTDDGTILGGHLRRLALLQLRAENYPEPRGVEPGWKVPVRVFRGSPVQELAVLAADNPDPADIDFDNEGLAAILAELQAEGELPASGYDEARLQELIDGLAATVEPTTGQSGLLPDADPDALPESAPTRCQAGDLWQLGAHRIIVGDCRDRATLGRLFGGEKANVAVTSPPYASQRKYDEESGFQPIPPDEYGCWFQAVQAGIAAHLADDGSYFLNIKEHCEDGQRHLYVKDLTLQHVREWGWRFVDEFCWQRPGVPGGWPNRFKNGWEPIFHFSQGEAIRFRPEAVSHETEHAFDYTPANGKSPSGSGLLGKEHGERFRDGMARPSNVVVAMSGGGSVTGLHQAEYPVALPEFFIKAFSDTADAIYDPFMGSGTTLIAAEKNDRRAFGCEVSPKYCDIILARWELATGKTATLLERPE